MKTRSLALLLTGLCLAALPLAAQTTGPVIFPDEDPLSPANLRLVWPATPGLRYEVRQSTNLQSWSTAPGYPATANGPAQQMPFQTTGNARFFQVRELDEQPPAIVGQYPPDGGFAVPRFANVTVQLTDATGINTNSIRLTIGTLGTFTLTNPPPSAANAYLTFTNGLLTFLNGGSLALGAWGSNIQATLIVADTAGSTATNTWRFDLEVQPQVVTNLFVFGSPQAQRTGQQIGNIPTAALARRFGPIPMDAGDPWTLELVASNRLELSYTNTAPGFATNLYVCNLTPVRPEDIFNRKITAISDDPANKRLTLFTLEVPLTDLATNGSASVSADSVVLETGTNGGFVKAFYVGGTITFPRIGYSLDGAEFTLKDSVGHFDLVKLTMEEQHWWLTPRLQVGLDLGWGGLKRFEAIASGNVDAASVWEADVLLAGAALETTLFDLPESLKPKTWMYLGAIGPVPVFASLGLDVKLKARAEAHATLNFRAGVRQTMDAAFGLTYNQPDVQWVNTFQFPPPEVIPFIANINAEGSFKVSLEPAVVFLVYGLAGVSAGVTPSAKVVFEVGTGQPLSGRLEADVELELKLAGPAFAPLNPKPEASLSLWHDEWHLFPQEVAIAFTSQPESQTRSLGASAYFSCAVSATGTPGYQWYFNNTPMAGQIARTLSVPSVVYGHAGNYQVRVTAGNQTSNSATAQLTVVPKTIPAGMANIPAGSFQMGDALGDDLNGGELPVHTVYVSAFYMDRTEVTKALWDSVYQWAITHGYSFDNAGSGKAANHPVQTIDWYDCVKWCNALSEQAGLVPAYYTSAAQATVYRSGQVGVQNDWVKWSSGYRLPTEAEWEKAARGGASGQRFPWSNLDTISHSQANYYSSHGLGNPYPYDVSPTSGYHPTFNDGASPYTSPVGYFAPNGYGLYDMSGNVWEWCWDWYGGYGSVSQTDPRGPGTVSNRVLRGGYWGSFAGSTADLARCAYRYGFGYPGYAGDGAFGFRCVRGL